MSRNGCHRGSSAQLSLNSRPLPHGQQRGKSSLNAARRHDVWSAGKRSHVYLTMVERAYFGFRQLTRWHIVLLADKLLALILLRQISDMQHIVIWPGPLCRVL